jgi:membrane protease YdiL (CAAX protease family)
LSFLNLVKSSIQGSIVSSLSGFGAVKVADFLRSTVSGNIINGFLCGPNSLIKCRFGLTGVPASSFCAEKIVLLKPLKSTFTFLGTAVNCVSEFPSYVLGFSEKSLLNVSLSAAGEELFCRGLVQRKLFRDIQVKILQKISANPESLVDHPIAKITRIAAASILFGLMHTRVWECRNGGTIPEIAAGVIFGILAETNYGLAGATLAHITANLLIS